MSDSPRPDAARSPGGPPNPMRRLDDLVGRAQLALWWERIWPALWGPLAVALVFVAASWLGLWLDLTPMARMVGVGLFGLAFLASLWPFVRLRSPDRGRALDRLDRDSGLKHRPARALEDTLALGSDDPGARALWDLHRRRAEAVIGKLRVAPPSPGMARRDRYALRAAAVVTVAASAFIAGPEIGARLRAAFDWRAPAAAPSFRIDGWIDPPLYTRLPPLMIDLAAGEQRLRAPIKSTLVVRIAGKGDVTVTPGAGLSPLPAPENPRPDLREQRFRLDGDADLSVRTGLASGLRLAVEAIPDHPPEIAFAGPPETNLRGTFNLAYRAKDDYGIVAAEGLVEAAGGARSPRRRASCWRFRPTATARATRAPPSTSRSIPGPARA